MSSLRTIIESFRQSSSELVALGKTNLAIEIDTMIERLESLIEKIDSFDDLRTWSTTGGLAFVNWNTTGFAQYGWHWKMLQQKRRIIVNVPVMGGRQSVGPTIPGPKYYPDKKIDLYLRPHFPMLEFCGTNDLPIALRFMESNWATLVGDDLNRKGNQLAGWEPTPDAANVFRVLPDGSIDELDLVDPLAGNLVWEREGKLFAECKYTREILSRVTSQIVVFDNNEVNAKIGQFTIPGKIDRRSGIVSRMWKSDMKSLNLRLSTEITSDDPYDLYPEWHLRSAEQYKTFIQPLRDTISRRSRVLTIGYHLDDQPNNFPQSVVDEIGPSPDCLRYDNTGAQYYCQADNGILTDPMRTIELLNQRNDMEWYGNRPFSLFVRIVPKGAMAGKIAGVHDVVTPERWREHVEWMLWQTHRLGVPTLLVYYADASKNPDDPFDNKGMFPELVGFTNGDYAEATLAAVDSIMDDSVKRAKWFDK